MDKIADDVRAINKKLTSRESDITIILSSTSSNFTTPLYPPLQLSSSRKWVIGLINLETYNSFSNINSTNNIFTYSIDNGVTWKTITLTQGSYEINQINNEIKRLMSPDAGIEIIVNTITLGSVVNITSANYKVDFTVVNSIATVLGFNSVVLSTGYNISPNIVNILNINSILVNCNIINNSYLNSSQVPVIYSFFPGVAPGRKIIEKPNIIIYLPLTSNFIENIRIWLTDQDGNSIDFRGETITCRLQLKQL